MITPIHIRIVHPCQNVATFTDLVPLLVSLQINL
jgi:hypothetical protein